MKNIFFAAFAGFLLVSFAFAQDKSSSDKPSYDPVSTGTRLLKAPASGMTIKMLVERSNLGGDEVEIGEVTFPAGYASQAHHHHLEIFYVLSGTLEHIVNGRSHLIKPGMVAIVRGSDPVIHRVASKTPVKALVVWAPGGEADRLARFLKVLPLTDKDAGRPKRGHE